MPSVLVAEDNASLARVISFTLRKAGFDVCQTNDGAVAWDQAQQTTFDLIVTDQQMPEMNGLELCTRVREQPQHAAVPIVLLTAKGMEIDSERVKESYGVTEMLLKPFSPTRLAQIALEATQLTVS